VFFNNVEPIISIYSVVCINCMIGSKLAHTYARELLEPCSIYFVVCRNCMIGGKLAHTCAIELLEP
jgi:hypothetical protein